MEHFSLEGNGNCVNIILDKVFGFPRETGYWGGYDTVCSVIINIDDFQVNSSMYSSTGEIFQFYTALQKCNDQVKGSVYFNNYEGNLDLELKYDITGQIEILGTFRKNNAFNCVLTFSFQSDQSYIQQTLKQLEQITSKYGNEKGIT